MAEQNGKLAIITGSAGGLGKEFARRLLENGFKVCISDVNQKLGEQTENDFSQVYGNTQIRFVYCDVRKNDDIRHLFKEAKQYFRNTPRRI